MDKLRQKCAQRTPASSATPATVTPIRRKLLPGEGYTTFEYGSGSPTDILEVLRSTEQALDALVGRAVLAILDLSPNDGAAHLEVIHRLAAEVHGPLTGAICDVERLEENSPPDWDREARSARGATAATAKSVAS